MHPSHRALLLVALGHLSFSWTRSIVHYRRSRHLWHSWRPRMDINCVRHLWSLDLAASPHISRPLCLWLVKAHSLLNVYHPLALALNSSMNNVVCHVGWWGATMRLKKCLIAEMAALIVHRWIELKSLMTETITLIVINKLSLKVNVFFTQKTVGEIPTVRTFH
jgi:hypothetical protein